LAACSRALRFAACDWARLFRNACSAWATSLVVKPSRVDIVLVDVELVEAPLEVVDAPLDVIDVPPEVASKVDTVLEDVLPEVVEPDPLRDAVRELRAF
jgi:hypothetical protein